MLFEANALHGEKGILGPAVTFFTNAVLLTPKIAIDGVALRDFVVTEALRETHASAVTEFAQQGQYFPLNIGRGSLGGIAEIDLVLDLQPAQLRVQQSQFFVDSHPEISWRQCKGSAARATRFP